LLHKTERYYLFSLETKYFNRLSAREIFRLSTGIFRKYPSQTWYICMKCGDMSSIFIYFCYSANITLWARGSDISRTTSGVSTRLGVCVLLSPRVIKRIIKTNITIPSFFKLMTYHRISYRYIMFGRGICEKYQSRDEKFPEPTIVTTFVKRYQLCVLCNNRIFRFYPSPRRL
jgi:hypothetical protein